MDGNLIWTQYFNRDSAALHTQAAIPSSFTSIVLNLSNVQAISQLEFQETGLPNTLSLLERFTTHLSSSLQVCLCILIQEAHS